MLGSRFKLIIGIGLTVLLFLTHEIGYSQDLQAGGNQANEQAGMQEPADAFDSNASKGAGNVGSVSLMTNREFILSVIILLFGTAIVLIEYFLLKATVNANVTDIMKIFTVTLIVIGTMLLISSGFSTDQISPAFGLFGTIAGYLLGREEPGKLYLKEGDKEVKNV